MGLIQSAGMNGHDPFHCSGVWVLALSLSMPHWTQTVGKSWPQGVGSMNSGPTRKDNPPPAVCITSASGHTPTLIQADRGHHGGDIGGQ